MGDQEVSVNSIYDVVDRETAEVKAAAPAPRIPEVLKGFGCGTHRFVRHPDNLILCTNRGCPLRLYPGNLHYADVAAVLSARSTR